MDAHDEGIELNNIEDIPESPILAVGKDGLPIALPGDGSGLPPERLEGDGTPITKISGEEEEEEEEGSVAKKPVGFLGTIMNLLNSLLGAGILSVPNCFVDTGIIGTTVLLVVIALLAYVATYFVVELQKSTKGEGFGDLAFRTIGKWGLIALDVLTLLFLVSAQLAYIIIGGDMILSWFAFGNIDLSSLWYRALVILVYSLALPMALTIPRDISFLSYFSTATVAFIVFYAVVIVYKGSAYITKNKGICPTCTTKFHLSMSMFSTLSIAALTFALPCVCLPSLKMYEKDSGKRNRVTFATIIVCTLLVLIPSLFGYFQFGSQTDANILNSYPNEDILMVVTRGVFFFVVSFAFPMVGQSTMSSWSSIIYKIDHANRLSTWKRALILLLNNGIPLVIAMFLKSAKPVLSIGGALGGCLANFTFPAMMFFLNSQEKWTHWKNLLTLLFALFGLVTGIMATYQAVIGAIRAFS